MRQVYIKEIILLEPATAVHYVYDDPVKPGQVLVIRNLCATFSAIANSEEAHFFTEDHGVKHYLGEDVALDTGGYPHWSGQVAIGERDRAGVYLPDSATDDEIHFFILGELWDLKDWRGEPSD